MARRSGWQDGREAWERLDEPSDPVRALGDVRLVGALLEEKAQELVVQARGEDRPWSAIGSALGMSRQAAWERWHALDPTEKEA